MTELLKDATPRPWCIGAYSKVMKAPGSGDIIHDEIPVKGFALGQSDEARANAHLIVTAVNSYEPMLAALEACRAWHYAEEKSLGDFYARCDLAAYSEHLTKIALGMEAEFSAPPQMIVWPTVELQRTEAATLSGWVDQLIEREAIALAKLEGEKP